MSALAGLSQQIISTANTKAPEKALSKASADKSFSNFDKNLDKFSPKHPKKNAPASKDYSVENKRSSSPEKPVSQKRIEERVSEKAGENKDPKNKQLTKKEAMWAFLDRMDQELGIQPSEVMNAFAKLDVDNLMAPPETSADEFVQNLDLNPQQQDKALNLYSQLLTWTSAASLSQDLQQKGQTADMNVMNSQEYQQKMRMAGLNDLSDKFFMNGQHTRENLLQSRENIQGFAGQNAMPMQGTDLADRLLDKQALGEQQVQPQANVGSTEELVRELQAESEALSQKDMAQLGFQQKLNALKSYGQPAQAIEQPVAVTQDISALNMNQLEGADQVDELLKANTQAVNSKDMSAFSQMDDGEAQMNMEGGDLSAQDLNLHKTTKTTSSDFIVKAPEPTETEMSENIREIINKAQIMVKKGGGEMKLSLRPEGMGNVNLKVNVVGGDVSVEMITASDETRKVLEKGLGDLKDNLSLQKLNVEQIKVESMQEAADKLMDNKQEQAERNFQERFLQDFRNQNGARRFGAFGLPAGKPESQGHEESSSEESKTQKSRRLDLVA